MYPRRKRSTELSRGEIARGWVFFLLYLFVFPVLLGQLQALLSLRFHFFLQPAEFSLIYYFLLLCAALVLFWGLLRRGFDTLLDDLPENLFAFVAGLVGAGVLHFLVGLLPLPEDPYALAYREQFAAAPAATAVVLVVLMPLLEELLFRGLLYGSLRWYSRGLACAASVVGYLLFLTLPLVFSPEGVQPSYLLLAVWYLPMSAALTWCYDYGGSIWSAAGLHMALNAASLLLAL